MGHPGPLTAAVGAALFLLCVTAAGPAPAVFTHASSLRLSHCHVGGLGHVTNLDDKARLTQRLDTSPLPPILSFIVCGW